MAPITACPILLTSRGTFPYRELESNAIPITVGSSIPYEVVFPYYSENLGYSSASVAHTLPSRALSGDGHATFSPLTVAYVLRRDFVWDSPMDSSLVACIARTFSRFFQASHSSRRLFLLPGSLLLLQLLQLLFPLLSSLLE